MFSIYFQNIYFGAIGAQLRLALCSPLDFHLIWLRQVFIGICPDQGLNLGPLSWEHGLGHWTTREVPESIFCRYNQVKSIGNIF